jgi:hypothetical protein
MIICEIQLLFKVQLELEDVTRQGLIQIKTQCVPYGMKL